MALATTDLSEAKAKFEQAQSEPMWHAGEGLAREAVKAAGQALVAARRAQDTESKLAALELVVQANMYLGDTFAANLAASDELAMIKRTGDKKAEAKALQLLAEVQTARGDGAGAAASLDSALALFREFSDKPAQAKTLGQLATAKLAAGKKNDALPLGQDALKLFQELGDKEGEEAATRTINMVYAEKNQLSKAPGRPQALEALKELAVAVDNRDARAWGAAMEELNRTGAYNQKDIDDTVNSALEKDRSGAALFLEEQGIVVKGSGKGGFYIKEVGKQMTYIGFRIGALGYGPRFRCLNAYKGKVLGDDTKINAQAVLQISEQAEDWETELQYHPGILDGMLQVGSAFNA